MRAAATSCGNHGRSDRSLAGCRCRLAASLRATEAEPLLLDYEDLIEGALRLLEGSGADWVLYKLDGGLDHLLVDEAQDTSPSQWRILHALTAECFAGEGARQPPRTVFAVGDVKQSIFSFQGAEPAAFLESRERYRQAVTGAGRDWRPIEMKTSFRSTRAVLQAVDAPFATPSMTQAIALEQVEIVHQAWRKLDGGSVELWPPLAARQPAKPRAWDPPIERVEADSPQTRLARLIALRIARMLESHEMLAAQGRPIRAGDIMVLVRRRTPFMQALIRALKERRVPVAGLDRMLLTEQLAVMDLLALARFVLLPEDNLTLATVLKGPMLGFDDDALFALAHSRTGTLWTALRRAAETGCPRATAARDFLASLLAEADRLAPFEFLMRALGPLAAVDGTATLADSGRRRLLARLGRDADDPIAELLESALAFERAHPPSLQGFLGWLERADVEIKRDPETSAADAVRVMTVHGAKGLQAPIVFLPDSCQTPQERFPLLWPTDDEQREVLLWPPRAEFREGIAEAERLRACERQHQEHMRLLYVAMTRAADRLIVCGWLTKKQEEPEAKSWYRLIEAGLRRETAAGELIEEVDSFLAGHPALTDSSTVVRLTCPQQRAPRRRDEPLAAPPIAPLPDWALRPAPEEPAAPRPLRPSHADEDTQPPVVSPLAAEQRFRRGRLIHRLLQELPELPADTRDAAARRWLARPTHRLTPAEQSEIAEEVGAVLADPLLAPLFGTGSRAEVPLSGVIGGRLIAGQLDRMVLDADTVTVLDLKSDRPPPSSAAAVHPVYLRQMAAYRSLLRAIYPDRAVRCVLLWTQTASAMPLEDPVLDRWAP
ncbi:MAG: UvrD-helicase domain-containing protein [Rhodospirillales bacterium]|nr:UvrD-helicase domain-containing protein [Rhodospirillales bacterium]